MTQDRLKQRDRVKKEKRTIDRMARGSAAGVTTVGGAMRDDRNRMSISRPVYLSVYTLVGDEAVQTYFHGWGFGIWGETFNFEG